MRFAVEIGADANGSWEGVHTLRHTLTCTARVWYGWRDEWGGDASRLATAAASEIVALLVEMGAQPSDDRASGEDKPLAWLAMDLWHPDILHLLLAAGLAVPRMFCGQSALDYLLHEYGKRGLNYLIGYLYSLAKLQPEVTLQALRVAHTWALLAEAGCPHSVPLPNLAMYLGDLKMQNQAGWVWVLAEGIPWTPRLHFLFPPAFRAAACTLLLVNHRGVPAASLGSCSSISQKRQQKKPNQRARAQQQQALQLPAAAVQRVLCLAAASLSSWLPPLPSCRLPAEA
ncbi:acylamide amidohydrolase [Chlorella sorokiniana]|uniref:Acylamide amidohydrolase n=1 Tax=Chlorella sorokiniana TaxID=3076 RepID=A0A2P6TFQ1_CHLSO|nr:acylamide amidohydrolase [Chlorella sorokiniana]|eukprot:PRW32946.1 acylamide amidohydrolase [Chlorella sorokiniana]